MKSNLLKKHAKSFYWASFFLSNNTLDKCSSLYNFCRTLDDIVDDDENLIVKKGIFSKFKKDFENKNLDNQIIKDMWSLIDSEGISYQIVIDLFDGVETDLKEKVVINSKKDLKYLVKSSQTPKGLNEHALKYLKKAGFYRHFSKSLNSILKRLNNV